jgi:hypothetical protein
LTDPKEIIEHLASGDEALQNSQATTQAGFRRLTQGESAVNQSSVIDAPSEVTETSVKSPNKVRSALANAYHATNRAGRRALAYGRRNFGSFVGFVLMCAFAAVCFWVYNAIYTWLLTISTGLAYAWLAYIAFSMLLGAFASLYVKIQVRQAAL